MRRALLGAMVVLSGCVGQAGPIALDTALIDSVDRGAASVPPGPPIPVISNAEAEAYLSRLAPMVVSRVLSASERTLLQSRGAFAVEEIVTAWTLEPGFAQVARTFVETTLNVSGTKDGVDYSLPGNLAAKLASSGRPWRELLTSDVCYARDGAVTPCDSDAPFKGGGVLTTRAYLKSRSSRFNLTRASTMLRTFACRAYPMENDLQPRAEKAELMAMFQASNAAEAEAADPRSVSGAANGAACYSCHGQFAHHAQLFVKYDTEGHYRAGADGVQSPDAELGRSTNGTMASHFAPGRSADEAAQIFSKPVANLAEAGLALADSPTFVECTAEFFLNYSLGLQWGIVDYDRTLMKQVAARAKANGEPSLGQVVVALLSEPLVMRSLTRPAP